MLPPQPQLQPEPVSADPVPPLSTIDSAMPGFESLDVPMSAAAPAPAADQQFSPSPATPQLDDAQVPELTLPPASDFITTRSGSDYISSDAKIGRASCRERG